MGNMRLINPLLLMAVLATGSAQGHEDRLSGVWRLSDDAAGGTEMADVVMRFRPDGTFETRWAGRTSSATNTGSIVTTGHYRVTGAQTYEADVEAAMACATPSSCAPYPDLAPSVGVGTAINIDVQLTGENEMTANGQRWMRQQE